MLDGNPVTGGAALRESGEWDDNPEPEVAQVVFILPLVDCLSRRHRLRAGRPIWFEEFADDELDALIAGAFVELASDDAEEAHRLDLDLLSK
jgi:hypothetical protein